jgi:hypothetical protein
MQVKSTLFDTLAVTGLQLLYIAEHQSTGVQVAYRNNGRSRGACRDRHLRVLNCARTARNSTVEAVCR